MAPPLAARSVILCISILGFSIARSAPAEAARRPVAVIALSDDEQAEAHANLLGTTLVHHDTLAPLEPGSMIGALVGEFLDESRDKIASAEGILVRAEGALANFVFPVAISTAQAGHESLHTVVPSTRAIGLYADLALVVGIAQLGQGKPVEAARFFGLVHRMSPGRRLDPALHLPTVVQAFELARPGRAATGRLIIKGSGRIWIDGKEQAGPARQLDVPEGLHVVWLTGFERETLGKQIYVEAGKPNVLELGDAPAPQRLVVQRARILLRDAANPPARAAAMRQLAALLDVQDAVVITISGGKLIVQAWHRREEGEVQPEFMAYRLAEGEKPADLLRPLVPEVRRPEDGSRRRPIAERPWYQRRGVQASIAVGVLGAVVGSVMFARSLDDRQIGLGPDLTFLPPKMAGP